MATFPMYRLPFAGSRQDTLEMEYIYSLIRLSSDIVVDGTVDLVLALATGTVPGLTRSFFGSVENLVPTEAMVLSISGNASVNNVLLVDTSSSLKLSLSYSGVAYDLGGPLGADISGAVMRLGFRRGDRIKLKGSVGTEPNHGKEFTLDNPTGFAIMESLTTPDANSYEFTVFRRLK
jgi:hypothetical protein